ncbi:Ig-like domain-containing protein, partial [Acinetobacter indicus]
ENGDFVVPVSPALTDGNTADVIAKDEAGNESDPVEITGEKDTIAPAIPSEVEINEDGTEITGKGEPGSEIVVTDKDGNILGTGTVDENGDFVVPVSPALTDGNTADVIAKDEAGNESDPVEITGEKDTIAPAIPSEVEINEDGTEITGKGEPGSEIVVTDKDGNILGTGTVDENGDFVVPVSPALTDGNTADV